MTTVIVLDDYQRVAHRFAEWEALGYQVDFVHEHLVGDALVDRLVEAQIVVAMRERTVFDAALLARLPRLRLLVTTGTANASIDLGSAVDAGVTVCSTRSLAAPTVELTWALILATARHVPFEAAAMREGAWQRTVGADLSGRRLGVLGLGRIGADVASIGRAFGMEVRAWSQNLDAQAAYEQGLLAVDRDEFFASCDVLSVHVRLSERTRHLVGDRELDAMPAGSILVNTARAGIVDQEALLRALDRGPLIGAGLDVFETEPLPVDHPLRRHPRVLCTPHLGYVTEGAYRVFYGDAVEDIAAWSAGQPIRVLASPATN